MTSCSVASGPSLVRIRSTILSRARPIAVALPFPRVVTQHVQSLLVPQESRLVHAGYLVVPGGAQLVERVGVHVSGVGVCWVELEAAFGEVAGLLGVALAEQGPSQREPGSPLVRAPRRVAAGAAAERSLAGRAGRARRGRGCSARAPRSPEPGPGGADRRRAARGPAGRATRRRPAQPARRRPRECLPRRPRPARCSPARSALPRCGPRSSSGSRLRAGAAGREPGGQSARSPRRETGPLRRRHPRAGRAAGRPFAGPDRAARGGHPTRSAACVRACPAGGRGCQTTRPGVRPRSC